MIHIYRKTADSPCRFGDLPGPVCALGLAAAISASSAADIVGLSADSYAIAGNPGCCVLDLYIQFDAPDHTLGNVFNADIKLSGEPNWKQDDLVGACPGSGSWLPQQTSAASQCCDSFITIGGKPGTGNATAVDPNFVFGPCINELGPFAGWFNTNPGNGQGKADADGRVLIGHFVVDAGATATLKVTTISVSWQKNGNPLMQSTFGLQSFDYSCCIGDLDGNGSVGGGDLGLLLADWGPCVGCPTDINCDGLVDGTDLGLLLAGWGACP